MASNGTSTGTNKTKVEAWNHFCEVNELEEKDKKALGERGITSIRKFYNYGRSKSWTCDTLNADALGDMHTDFPAFSNVVRQELFDAWIWLDLRQELIADYDGFVEQFTDSYSFEVVTAAKKRKAEMDAEEDRKKSRSEFTLESQLGTHYVEMNADELLEYIEGFQSRTKIRESDVINSQAELNLELHGRKGAWQKTVEAFQLRKASLMTNPPPEDRTQYPVLIYSGMSGLGKTRMLEECSRALEAAKVTPDASVLISYSNGHGVQKIEEQMEIQASFGWRLLHRMFVEGNCTNDVQFWHSAKFLPNNANSLTVGLAIQVVLNGAKKYLLRSDDKPLSLFVGVDEYQRIPKGPYYDPKAEDQKAERLNTFLWRLNEALDECRKIIGLHLYLAFAGTEWGPFNIAGASLLHMVRAPMTLLSNQDTEDVVRSISDQTVLSSPTKRRELFYLGGIPRPSFKFALKDGENFDNVWEMYIVDKWFDSEYGLTSEELLKLVAFAVSRQKVGYSDQPGIKKMTWGSLVDNGFCMLTDGYVDVPYCVFRLAATRLSSGNFEDLASKCLFQNLEYMHYHVDESLFRVEEWQAWETFGACYFAMRVNALLVLGHEEIITFADLFTPPNGAILKGCQDRVRLCPMEVHTIKEELSKELKDTVTENQHYRRLMWVQGGHGGVRYSLVNGVVGKGVDFFATLNLADEDNGLLLYNDQRKMVASSSGDLTARNLLKSASITPACLKDKPNSKCVRGLFSALASCDDSLPRIPDDCVVLSHRQSKRFHGTLSLHPACRPFVDVNFDNVSTLKLLTSIKKIASLIIRKRNQQEFKNVNEFCEFCKEKGHIVSDDDRLRVVAELPQAPPRNL